MDEKLKELKEKFDPMVYFLYESDIMNYERIIRRQWALCIALVIALIIAIVL